MNSFRIRAFIPSPSLRIIPLRTSRGYAVQAPGAPTLEIFNRQTKWLQKERAASDVEGSRNVDYLRNEVASRLCERLLDINRHFPEVLDLGANACNIARMLTLPSPESPDAGPRANRISNLTAAESSRSLLYRDEDLEFNNEISIIRDVLTTSETLPYDPNTFDAVLSSLSMHWTNDLPSVLAQVNNILKPDSPFLGVMIGGDSLFELRTSLQLAEQDRRGGVSTHTSPLADVRDIGGLLQKAGFNLLTVDVDDIVVDFPDSFALMRDLQAMGESNAVLGREMGAIQRDVLLAAEGIYRELHGNEDGSIPATFRLIYMIGWKDGPNQAKPLPRGSGMVSIKDVLESQEGGSGDQKK
ncbi:S-adenosyl-L-methionine-dependent methyltransferase [Lepidopterella palustris CBS 459.81]|uniref:S-adenosyl-L-methionine-dependent methyltransferase n=1 Tax=Lepidopterella palustris CBS 459.81 TaxID=1314670 RepID=A0A8E2JFI2_9PEZI|nr:S-adenosyl-L-methionine-dependent methyltransferase [Lepidopterella palustris CBS 459.81]